MGILQDALPGLKRFLGPAVESASAFDTSRVGSVGYWLGWRDFFSTERCDAP